MKFRINLTKIHEFIHSYVTGNYLKRLFFKFHKEIDETIRANNAWRNVTLLNETKSHKPLLQVSQINVKILDFQQLAVEVKNSNFNGF